MGFYLPRWQDEYGGWTGIDPVQIRWVKRTEPRYLPWAALGLSAAVLVTTYVGFSLLVRSAAAWAPVLWLSLAIVGVVMTGGLQLAARLAPPPIVGISDRGVVFGRIGGVAVEWNRLLAARRSRWGIAVDYPMEPGWWFVRGSLGTLIWSNWTASRYVHSIQFQAILPRP